MLYIPRAEACGCVGTVEFFDDYVYVSANEDVLSELLRIIATPQNLIPTKARFILLFTN